MSELAAPLRDVLERTGYLTSGEPAAPSVALAGSDRPIRLRSFEPDAWWRSNSELSPWSGNVDIRVFFKYVDVPVAHSIAEWQQEVWNQGFCPLLWIVSPERIDLYNGFGYPQRPEESPRNRLDTFRLLDEELKRLDLLAGRLAMETGQFWRHAPEVNRKTSVDGQLLRALGILERDLVEDGLSREAAQGLIGRSIFTQYLIDRKIVDESRMEEMCGHQDLPAVLSDPAATGRLFDWLRETFNGDMFPPASGFVPAATYLSRVGDFLTATDPETGQRSLFPYQFDVIPVELISSIYEQFVHSSMPGLADGRQAGSARSQGVFYTPLAAVSLVLDEVFDGLTGGERVLDLSCGSGVFLVEALRRLVALQSSGAEPTRSIIRTALYQQVHGVDINPAAVRIAAFSLYLAALELDPRRRRLDGLRFQPLVDNTLRVGDAFEVDLGPRKFDVIVGNPPWSYRGRQGTAARRIRSPGTSRPPRGESLDFVDRARLFAHDRTRFGMILSATPFFSRSGTGVEAAQSLVEALAPVALVNLSDLSGWLFPKANMPAVALLARIREQPAHRMTLAQAWWSPASTSSHTIEIAPSDVTTLPIASWQRNAGLFKAAFLGRRHDLLLLDDLWEKLEPLETRLEALGTSLKAGLKFGNRSADSALLTGLPFAGRGTVSHFTMGDDLPVFQAARAERPRQIATYRAPLLLLREFILQQHPRPIVAVTKRDTVYGDACFGISFADTQSDVAYLLAGVLGSALASWYFLMTGSTFGLWMRRLLRADVVTLPTPDLEASVTSGVGEVVVRRVRALHQEARDDLSWESLDNAVFDLYGLDDEDRIVVRDGLYRASWQWEAGRLDAVERADLADLERYARAFLSTMDSWLSASNRRRMRAEIYELSPDSPLCVVRFVLENSPGPSVVEIVAPDGPLSAVLSRIGERTKVRITEALVGVRELRVHARDEVSIIKPAARRNWLAVRGLEDADEVVQDSVSGIHTK